MGFKVNVSEQENKAGERKVLPAGKYRCAITEVEQKASKSDANYGKDMLYFYMTVQDGVYADQQLGVNACCWSGALYTIVNLLKAIGEYDNCKDASGQLDIPSEQEFYLGRELMVRQGINPKAKKENPTDDPDSWLEVRGFAPIESGEAASSSTGVGGQQTSSLLP
jgi:hypothetical protein